MSVNSEPLFDHANLESELDEDGAVLMAQAFLRDTQGIAKVLDDALEKQDASTLQDTAHKLAGCCRVIFCHQLAKESSALEKVAQLGDWSLVTNRLSRLQPLVAALNQEIADYLSSKS